MTRVKSPVPRPGGRTLSVITAITSPLLPTRRTRSPDSAAAGLDVPSQLPHQIAQDGDTANLSGRPRLLIAQNGASSPSFPSSPHGFGSAVRITSPRVRVADLAVNSANAQPARLSAVCPPGRPASLQQAVHARHSAACPPGRGAHIGGYPLQGNRAVLASDSCLAWLKQCQSDSHAEEKVGELLHKHTAVVPEHIRNRAYLDATKCATSLARRAKPARWT